MKHLFLLVITIVLCSCGNEKTLILPEIEHANITEVRDVSHAYLFYDETQADSIELNRKNLISTTNWLINVDKRLTLDQAIPKIKFLQDKKRNAKMHKNEAAKNYYTCNDTSIKNLGFIEFTDVYYIGEEAEIELPPNKSLYQIVVNHKNEIQIIKPDDDEVMSTHKTLVSDILNISGKNEEPSVLILAFDKGLSFQDYITIKSLILELKSKDISIDTNEFIY